MSLNFYMHKGIQGNTLFIQIASWNTREEILSDSFYKPQITDAKTLQGYLKKRNFGAHLSHKHRDKYATPYISKPNPVTYK